MGGQITIAARFNDGQAISIYGWTNFMKNMILNSTTLDGDDSIVKRTLLEAAENESLGGPAPLRKNGYGIVVIDFPEREIHSIQGYCDFRQGSMNQLLDLNATGWQGNVFKYVFSEEARSLLDSKRVLSAMPPGSDDFSMPYEERVYTCETARAILEERHNSFMHGDSMLPMEIVIRTEPFVIYDYEDIESFTETKRHLAARGFPTNRKAGLNRMLRGSAKRKSA